MILVAIHPVQLHSKTRIIVEHALRPINAPTTFAVLAQPTQLILKPVPLQQLAAPQHRVSFLLVNVILGAVILVSYILSSAH